MCGSLEFDRVWLYVILFSVCLIFVSVTTSEHVYLWFHNHNYKIDTSSWTNIIVRCSIQVTPISKLTALKITLENISCQILRRVHIVTYKISHQFYMVATIAKHRLWIIIYLVRVKCWSTEHWCKDCIILL